MEQGRNDQEQGHQPDMGSSTVEYLTFITATDEGHVDVGKNYTTKYSDLAAITAVHYKINSERVAQFRKWATGILESYTLVRQILYKSHGAWRFQ